MVETITVFIIAGIIGAIGAKVQHDKTKLEAKNKSTVKQSDKRESKLNNICRNYYDNNILRLTSDNPWIGKPTTDIAESIINCDSAFANIEINKIIKELIMLRFELFALVWTHKYISGKNIIAQNTFTKLYLQEKNLNHIWDTMKTYSNIVNVGTLKWLMSLGNINIVSNGNMREALTTKNIEAAKELNIEDSDIIERANFRLLSENAWRQQFVLNPLIYIFCEQVGIDANTLTASTQLNIANIINEFYGEAIKGLKNIKL